MFASRSGRAGATTQGSASPFSLRSFLATALVLVATFVLSGALAAQADAGYSAAGFGGLNLQAADGDQDDPDGAGALTDWQNYIGQATTVLDAPLPSGVGNDTFYKGKINEPNTWVLDQVSGGVTPGKANALSSTYLVDEAGDTWFYFNFIRADTSTAETHYSIELRKLTTTWVNDQGTTIPCRSDGDLLLVFAVQANIKNVEFTAYEWTSDPNDPGPAECPEGKVGTYTEVDLGNNVAGYMNFDDAITNYIRTDVFGNQLLEGRFGEGAINLSATLGQGENPCFSFGEAQFFSLSSNSFDSAMQDMITPAPISARNCSASGTKWRDDNANGTREQGEPGLAGWTFWVDYDDDGVLDANEPSGVSGPTGAYTITDINPAGAGYPANAAYRIHERAPNGVTGYTCTYPNALTTGGGVDFHGCYWSATFATTGNQTGFDFGNAPPADLSVVKTPDAQTVDAGDPISFTMVTNNAGLGVAKGVTLSDPLPDGVTWTITAQTNAGECAITGVGNDQVLNCAYGDLASGQSRSVTISAQTSFNACATYNNTATVDATNTLPDSDSGQVTCRTPNLTETKTPNDQTVDAGDAISFTVVTANTGPGTAKNVTVNDPLPAGVDWSITAQTNAGECSITGAVGSEVLSCAYGDLAAGQSRSVTVSATTSFAACGVFNNTATASADNAPDAGDDGRITCKTPGLTETKTPNDQTVDAGDAIAFTIVTANSAGAGTAKNVTVNDPLPAGVDWSISAQTNAGDCSITGAVGSEVLTCAYGDLAAGQSRSVTVSAQTSYTDCAIYDNTATASADNAPDASDSGKITCKRPTLGTDKAALQVVVDAGDDISFTVTTSNTGEGTAKGVMLNDPLPDGVTWSITSQTNAGECEITGAGDDQVLACDYGDLAPGASRAVTVKATTSFDACSVYDNTATASAANAPSDSDDASVVCNKPSVSIDKTTSTGTINAGDVARFAVKVTNGGPGTAKNVVISDPLPAGPTWSFDGAAPAGCVLDAQKVTCTIASMASGSSFTFNVKATTTQENCAVYNNTATGTGSNTGPIAPDSATVTCRKLPAISIDKTGPATATAGDRISYALAVTNTGPTSYAEGLVVVTDALCEAPPALVSKNGDASPGTLDPGETWSYSCTVQTQVGQTVVNNIGVVNGTDVNGNKASAQDGADTVLSQPAVAPAPAVQGVSVPAVPGSAKLRGPSGCLLRPTQKVYVTGRQILKVRFVLDKKTLGTVTKPDKNGRYGVTITRKNVKFGSHRVQAIVTFRAASNTKPRTLQLRFSRCGEVKPARAKGFTG